MLSLDSPEWIKLQHAYGSAGDIPDMLCRLKQSTAPVTDYESEPWFGLWSALCHQDDVYTASYAAVPHMVSIAEQSTTPVDLSFFQLPVAVEAARIKGRGPETPENLGTDYHLAIKRLADAVYVHRNEAWDCSMTIVASAAIAISKGHADLAMALLNLDDDIIRRINEADL